MSCFSELSLRAASTSCFVFRELKQFAFPKQSSGALFGRTTFVVAASFHTVGQTYCTHLLREPYTSVDVCMCVCMFGGFLANNDRVCAAVS